MLKLLESITAYEFGSVRPKLIVIWAIRSMRVAALAAFLSVLPATAGAADVTALFAENCVACHREGGIGTPGLAPPIASTVLSQADPQKARHYASLVVLYGLSGPIVVNGQTFVSAMPPRPDLADGDVAALITYVLHDLNALKLEPPIEPAEIDALRKKRVSHQELRDMRAKLAP